MPKESERIRMGERRRILSIVVLLLSALWLAGCQLPAQTPAQQGSGESLSTAESVPDLGTIRIGHLPILTQGYFAVAEAKGYFAEQGLTVELVPFQNGGAMVASLSTGDLDLGAGEVGTGLFNAIQQGLDVKVVSVSSQSIDENSALYLFVRKDLYESGELTEPADMAGRKVAINALRGLTEFLIARTLKSYGLSIDDIELIALPFPELPTALANGAVDVVYLVDPLARTVFRDETGVLLLSGSEIGGPTFLTAHTIGRRLLEPENEEVTIRLLTAIHKAIQEHLLDPDHMQDPEILEIFTGFAGLPPSVIQVGRATRFSANGLVNEENLLAFQSYYTEQGYTNYRDPLTVEEIYDSRYIEEVNRRLADTEPSQ
jgi:NitT/TauT family transport system substrate-binding protein